MGFLKEENKLSHVDQDVAALWWINYHPVAWKTCYSFWDITGTPISASLPPTSTLGNRRTELPFHPSNRLTLAWILDEEAGKNQLPNPVGGWNKNICFLAI